MVLPSDIPSEEEGELPFDQPVRDWKGGDQESGEASGFDEGEVPEEGADEDEKPPHLMPRTGNTAVAGPAHRQHGARKDMMSPKEGSRASPVELGDGAGGKGGPMATRGEEGLPREGNIDNGIGGEHREREELQSLLRELTRYVSVQDAMRSLDTVCQDLKKAIKKLDKLFRVCKRKKGEEVEAYPDCFAFSKKIMEGLKSVHLVVGTSIGHTKRMEGVLMLFKAAMNYRHDVLAGNQKQELEGWVRGSKVLKVIVEEKERAKAESARAAAALEGTPGAGERHTPTPGPETIPGAGGGDGDGGGGGEGVVAAGGAKSMEGPPSGAGGGGEGGREVGGALKGPEIGMPQDGDVGGRPFGENCVAAQQQGGSKAQTLVAGGVGEEAHAQGWKGPESLVQREEGGERGAGETAPTEAGPVVQGWGGRVEHGGELLPPPLPVPAGVPPPPAYPDGGPAPPQLPNGMVRT
ncbi:hypothetical protein DUNSADRAFT_17252 [Dunaliella salina]|uniref:Uncharacterized protein n=1 Tax=Dunaliella salina TaxID=3046 RepID=A0ABQ7H0A9_DUNSA|nr:hypothetical protein DUNSADRAFT_17252 [Dunaliella salina]|eukprot:KAF5840283.1 hypothetical protein DUNSADRAFT_17252 [Dunaliella salina]